MTLKSSLFLLLMQVLTLSLCMITMFYFRPAAEQIPLILGWAVASLNFTVALFVNMRALKKSFEAFKLILFGGSALRMGAMLIFLFIVVKIKPEWVWPFSFSLLSCFGIYIISEVGLFYIKARRMMS